MKWRSDSVGRFYDSNESTVVYFDSHSGDTHLLSEFAAYIMQQFAGEPLTTEELMNKISPEVESGDVSDLRESVVGILEELFALDLLKQE